MPVSVLNKENQTHPKIKKKKRKSSLVEESSALVCTLLLGVYCSLFTQVRIGRVNTRNASKCHCHLKIMCHYFTVQITLKDKEVGLNAGC